MKSTVVPDGPEEQTRLWVYSSNDSIESPVGDGSKVRQGKEAGGVEDSTKGRRDLKL